MFHVRTELADGDHDRLAFQFAEFFRQLEQFQCIRKLQREDALFRTQRGELGFVFVVLAADLRERAVFAHAHRYRLAGHRIDAEIALAGAFRAVDLVGLLVERGLELFPEFFHQHRPRLLAAGHRVELVFQFGGEVVVDVMFEMRGQKAVDQTADVGRPERAAFQQGIGLVNQGLDDAGVGRRTADAVLFQGLHQTGLGIARRRLGEMLFAEDVVERDALAFDQRRQLGIGLVVLAVFLVLAFFVHQQEARIDHGGAGGAETVLRAGGEFDTDRVERGRNHLTGHRAFPDQFVQAAFVVAQVFADAGRRASGKGRPDGLMRFLGVLRFRFVDVSFRRQVVFAEFLHDDLAQLA